MTTFDRLYYRTNGLLCRSHFRRMDKCGVTIGFNEVGNEVDLAITMMFVPTR
jgi:hypothetical protein